MKIKNTKGGNKALLIIFGSALILSGCGKEEEKEAMYNNEEISKMVYIVDEIASTQYKNISVQRYQNKIDKYKTNYTDDVYRENFDANEVKVDRRLRFMDYGIGLYAKDYNLEKKEIKISGEPKEYILEYEYKVKIQANEENMGLSRLDRGEIKSTQLYRIKGLKIIDYKRYDKLEKVEGARE